MSTPKEFSAKQLADYLISEFLARGRDWDSNKDAFYTKEHPELANKKEFVAKAWQIAHRDWAKMQTPPQPPPQKPETITAEPLTLQQTSARQPLILPQTPQGQPLQINVNVGVPQNPTNDTAKSNAINAKPSGENATFDRKLARNVDSFATELLKTATSFERIAKSTLRFKGDTVAALLEAVKDLILEMQHARIPQKLIEETLEERYRAPFHALNTAIGMLVKASGEMPKGWEKAKLPVILGEQGEKPPANGSQTAPVSSQLASVSTSKDDPLPFYSDLIPNFGYDEALKCVRRVAIFSGGNLSQTASGVPRDERPFKNRWDDYVKSINMMVKMGRPFDAAFLADQMGSPDIANMMRNQGIAGAFGAMGGQQGGASTTIVPGNFPVPSGNDFNPDTMLNQMTGYLRLMMNYQFMAPMMQGMTRTMGLGGGMGGLGDPRVEELLKKMEQQEKDKVTDALQRQIDALQKKEDPASQIMIKNLEFQLQQMRDQQAKDSQNAAQIAAQNAQTEQLKSFFNAFQQSGGNAAAILDKLQQQNKDHDRQRELDRQRYDLQIQGMQQNERQLYVQRLQSLEEKLDKASVGQSGDILQQYSALRQVIKDEVEDFKKLTSEKGDVPQLLGSVVGQLAPALTELAKRGGAPAAGPVAAAARTPQTQTPTVTGTCQWCQQQVTVPNVPQTNCPLCGRVLYPQAGNQPAPQAPVTVTPPPAPFSAGVAMPVNPGPVIPGYDSPVRDGVVVRPRRPDEVVII